MPETAAPSLEVVPVVAWPQEAEPGRTYLMEVDLGIPSGATWPYDEEEVLIRCIVSVGDGCGIEPEGNSALVLHRFGATYGPARFLLTAYEPVEDAALKLTLLSRAGMPIGHFLLPMRVHTGAPDRGEAYTAPRRAVVREEAPRRGIGRPLLRVDPLDEGRSVYPVSFHVDDAQGFLTPVAMGEISSALTPPAPPAALGATPTPESIRAFLLEHEGMSEDFMSVGAYLHALLSRGDIGVTWRSVVASNEGAGLLLEIRDPRLRRVPWELMHDGPLRLAADVSRPLQRVTPSFPEGADPEPLQWPLRVLIVAGANDAGAEDQIATIGDAVSRIAGLVDLEVVRDASSEFARDALSMMRPHIVHLLGHGADERGGAILMHGADLGELRAWPISMLTEDWRPRLVILDICRSVRIADQDAAWSLAESFSRLGVPAVMTMQADIRAAAAGAFMGELYRSLVDGEPLDVAVARGRRAIMVSGPPSNRDFALPSLTVISPPASVVPVGFRMNPDVRRLLDPTYRSSAAFLGRTRERRELWRFIETDAGAAAGGVLAITGPREVGKSRLARWCVESCLLRGGNAAYVDLGRPAPLDAAGVLQLIGDTLSVSPVHAEQNRRAFEGWAEEAQLIAFERVAARFKRALLTAAAGSTLLIVLDNVAAVGESDWSMICDSVLTSIARRELDPVRAILVLSDEQMVATAREPLVAAMEAPLALRPFTQEEFKAVALQYLRARFDVERAELERILEMMAPRSGSKQFTWREVTALAQLGETLWNKVV